MKKTKIICSIGPASSSVDVMSKMVDAGMNVARINFSHATMEERVTVVNSVKKVREITGANVAILYDTKGPEFRNGMLEGDEITLVAGKTIRVVKEEVLGNTERFSVNHPSAIDVLSIGSVILLENGLMKIVVKSIEDDGVTCDIVIGGILGNKKSLSAPGLDLNIPFVSETDKNDIIYAGTHDGDFLALSFVSKKSDVLEVKEILKENNCEDIKIISKIESQTGIDNLEEILEVSDGIMVARGDLGVEIPMYELPFAQKNMIKRARAHGKVVIVATEMLESMKKNARPTRAEISDVTEAVLDGTDAVMLSGETTVGKYPIETVSFMSNICEYAESELDYKSVDVKSDSITRKAICTSAVEAAKILDAKLIVTASLKGSSAIMVSNLKPICPVLANVRDEKVARSLAASYGVYPVVVKDLESTDEVVEVAITEAKRFMELQKNDVLIITGGFPNNVPTKHTNFMKIEVL